MNDYSWIFNHRSWKDLWFNTVIQSAHSQSNNQLPFSRDLVYDFKPPNLRVEVCNQILLKTLSVIMFIPIKTTSKCLFMTSMSAVTNVSINVLWLWGIYKAWKQASLGCRCVGVGWVCGGVGVCVLRLNFQLLCIHAWNFEWYCFCCDGNHCTFHSFYTPCNVHVHQVIGL